MQPKDAEDEHHDDDEAHKVNDTVHGAVPRRTIHPRIVCVRTKPSETSLLVSCSKDVGGVVSHMRIMMASTAAHDSAPEPTVPSAPPDATRANVDASGRPKFSPIRPMTSQLGGGDEGNKTI